MTRKLCNCSFFRTTGVTLTFRSVMGSILPSPYTTPSFCRGKRNTPEKRNPQTECRALRP